MINAIIFDLDLTLVDSLEASTIGINMVAREFGLPEVTKEQTLKAMPLPDKIFWRNFWGTYDESWNAFFKSRVIPEVTHLCGLYPGAEDILQSAKQKGLLLAIATNRVNPWIDLALMNIAKYFDTAVGASDVPNPKPEPDMLLAVLRQLGVEASSSIYVGDTAGDMKCAAGAGLRGLGLLQGGCTQDELMQAGAFAVRPTLSEGRDLLGC
ncbi:MAG: HAD family hydrolase [Deltaproteobacteria bacterium]|jgi:HAD superfamily hydrolase (TIGR01509 family)|nr:HAD family hydrolase [Deltaproteobacteria bacterium]